MILFKHPEHHPQAICGKIRDALFKIIISSLTVFLFAQKGYSLPSDGEQAINLQSDQAEFDHNAGTTTYSGSVIMEQGSMRITADRIIIFGKIDRANKIVAIGKPARFQQTPKVDALPVTALASTLEYQVESKTLHLIDNASLDQEGVSLTGNHIEYDVINSVMKARSSQSETGPKKRVRTIIPPKTFQTED